MPVVATRRIRILGVDYESNDEVDTSVLSPQKVKQLQDRRLLRQVERKRGRPRKNRGRPASAGE